MIKWLLFIIVGGFHACDQISEPTKGKVQVDKATLQKMELNLSPSELHNSSYLDSMYKLLEDTQPHPDLNTDLNRVFRSLGWRYVDIKNYGQAVVCFNMAIKVSSDEDAPQDLIYALLAKGQLFESFDDYKEAAKNYYLALEHSLTHQEDLLTLTAYNDFASLEIKRGDYPRARYFAHRGIQMEVSGVKTNAIQRMLMQLYNVQGLGYHYDSIYPQAIQSFQAAINIDNTSRGNQAGFIYGNIGAVFSSMNQNDSAEYYLLKDFKISSENNEIGSQYNAGIALAELYLKQADYQNGLLMLNKCDSLRSLYPSVFSGLRATKLRVALLKRLESKDNQLKALYSYVDVLSQRLENSNQQNVQQLQALVSINEAARRFDQLEKAKNNQENSKNKIILLLVLFILLTFTIIGVFYYRNQYFKQNAQIGQLTLEAKINELELLKRDKILQEKELRIQNQILDSQSKQLTDVERRHKQAVLAKEYIIDLKNKLIKSLLGAVEPVEQLPSGVRNKIEMAIRNIGQLEENSFIKTFDKESGHADFSHLLQEKYPDLSSEEIKLCTLLRLNMSTKEIARLKMITIAGVNKSRNRLRKKFELKPEEDLNSFLMSI